MRGARAALVRCHDHAEAAPAREFQRALLLDLELGTKDMHGAALDGWTRDDLRLTHRPLESETILSRKRRCQE